MKKIIVAGYLRNYSSFQHEVEKKFKAVKEKNEIIKYCSQESVVVSFIIKKVKNVALFVILVASFWTLFIFVFIKASNINFFLRESFTVTNKLFQTWNNKYSSIKTYIVN